MYINIGTTKATTLDRILPDLSEDLKGLVILRVKRDWRFIKNNDETEKMPGERSSIKDGKFILAIFNQLIALCDNREKRID